MLSEKPVTDPGEEVYSGQANYSRHQVIMGTRQLLPEQPESLNSDMEVAGLVEQMHLRHEIFPALAILRRLKIGIIDIDILEAGIPGDFHVMTDFGIADPAITVVKNFTGCIIHHSVKYNNKRPRKRPFV